MARKKKELTKISLAEFVNKGVIKNRRGKPASHSYLYRLIREHHAGTRETIPFEYIMEGEKDRIFIVSED
jgi:hypothetical protein